MAKLNFTSRWIRGISMMGLMLGAIPSVAWASQPPTGTDRSFTIDEEASYPLKTEDFGFMDAGDIPPDNFLRIQLTSLPTAGSLTLDGLPVVQGESIPMTPISGIVWTKRTDKRRWNEIAMSADGMTMAALGPVGTSIEIFISTDGGISWQQRGFPSSWSSIACSADGMKMVACASLGQLYTSTDAGVSWTARGTNRAWHTVRSSADGTILYAQADSNFRSMDSGVTWSAMPAGPVGYLASVSPDGMHLLSFRYTVSGTELYASVNAGNTWASRGPMPGIMARLAASADGTRLLASGYNTNQESIQYLCNSPDGGQTWTTREGPLAWSDLTVSSDGKVQAACNYYDKMLVSTDYGYQWKPRDGENFYSHVACSADGTKLLAVRSDAELFTSDPTVPVLSYRPPVNQIGIPYASFSFQVADSGGTPDDVATISNTITFNVTNLNDAPVATGVVATPFAPVGNPFHLVIPAEGFSDVDPGTILTYSASRSNGEPLPAWLGFDPLTLTFSGSPSPSDRGELDLRITATDNGLPPLSAHIDFLVLCGSNAPSGIDSVVTTDEDIPYTFTASDFGFADALDTPPDEFAKVRITTLPSKGTLRVDGYPVEKNEIISVGLEARRLWKTVASDTAMRSFASSADGVKLAAASGDDLRFSSDSGLTWIKRQTGLKWNQIAGSADGMKLVASIHNGLIHTSTDFGVTWQPRDSARRWISVASSADGTNLVAATDNEQIYTSADSGATWAPHGIVAAWKSVAISADGTRLAAVSAPGQIHTSADSGVSWTPREQSRSWLAVASSADGSWLAALDSSNLYVSGDFGISWRPMLSGTNLRSMALSSDGQKIIVTSQNNRYLTSRDGGNHWTNGQQGSGWLCVASSADGNKLVASGGGSGIYTSVAAVPELRYTPFSNENGSPYSSFTFQVEDLGTLGIYQDPTPNTMTINVRPVNDPPYPAPPLQDRFATERQPLTVQFTPTTFSDVDANTVLTYTARGEGGAALPAWLNWNPATLTFSGTPGVADTGIVNIEVTATDNGSPPGSRMDDFAIFVANIDETPSGADGVVSLEKNSTYTFTPADFGFSDTNDSPADAFSRVRLTTLPAAGTLSVNGNPAPPGTSVRISPGLAGADWTARDSTRNWGSLASSADGTKLVVGAGGISTTGRLYNSTDSGATWTARENVRNWHAVACSSDGMKMAAVATPGQIYTSTDAGANWTPRAFSSSWRSLASSADGTKLVTGEDSGKIHTSTDSGLTWVARTQFQNWSYLASSSDGTHLAAALYPGRIYVSSDSGVTWTVTGPSMLWHGIASSADGTKLAAVVQDGRIYTSVDSGMTWKARELVRTWYSIASSADGNRLAAVAQNGRIYISTDSGVTWKARESNRSWRTIASSADGLNLVAAVNGGQIFTSQIKPADTLTYHPITEGVGSPYTSFTFQVQDDASTPAAALDPTPNQLSINVTGPMSFQSWAMRHSLPLNPMTDNSTNLFKYYFGMEPVGDSRVLTLSGNAILNHGIPSLHASDTSPSEFSALYARRKDSGLPSRVQFSGDLSYWESSNTQPAIVAEDEIIEACAVPFPTTLSNGQTPKFFRVMISIP